MTTASDNPPNVSPPDVLFYHLEHFPLERVLPMLLEKTLERGWRAVVQVGSAQRVETLDALLWTYRDDSFLPHSVVAQEGDGPSGQGTSSKAAPGGTATDHPIFLTLDDDNPNDANVRFLVDGAAARSFEGYERMVIMFDGHDREALNEARRQWKAAKEAGCAVTYWQQSQNGGWEKKA